MRLPAIALGVAMLAACGTAAAAQTSGSWTGTVPGGIVAISPEHPGNCLAALTARELRVWTYEGRLLWRRDLTVLGKSFRPGLISLAPSCDWAAVAGDSAYRYVWILGKDGTRRYIAFPGETPVSMAISPDGGRLSVVTGAVRLHLFDGLPLHPVRTIKESSQGLARAQTFTSDGRLLLNTQGYGTAMLTRDGAKVWEDPGGYCWMSPADTSTWFIAVCEPPHGPGGAHVIARDASGAELWMKGFETAKAALGVAAPHAILLVTEEDERSRFMAVGRDGTVKVDVPVEATFLLGVTPDGAVALLAQGTDDSLYLRWFSAAGRELASEEISRAFWGAEIRRDLTRLIMPVATGLRVMRLPDRNGGR